MPVISLGAIATAGRMYVRSTSDLVGILSTAATR
jgi:hypothetical protein